MAVLLASSGKYLAYFETVPGKATDLMMLPLEGDETSGWKPGKPQTFLTTTFNESSAMFSPDGRWVAYLSNESGSSDVFVRPFPGPGGKWQISTSRRRRSDMVAYVERVVLPEHSDLRLMSVPYRVDGDSFQADKPQVWLDARLGGRPRPPSRDLDLHPDGKRFAIGSSEEQSPEVRNRVVLIFNFFDELKTNRTCQSRNRQSEGVTPRTPGLLVEHQHVVGLLSLPVRSSLRHRQGLPICGKGSPDEERRFSFQRVRGLDCGRVERAGDHHIAIRITL